MIVVIGSPVGRSIQGRITLAGLASATARAASAAGAQVQLVGRVGDDPPADAVLLELAAAGVGHVAVLRDPARPTPIIVEPEGAPDTAEDTTDDIALEGDAEATTSLASAPIELDAEDVELGLRYLTDFAVLVLVPPAEDSVVRIAVDGARWASARLILVVDGQAPAGVDLPPDAIVLSAPAADPDAAFASVVGRLAAALDSGVDPATAFEGAVGVDGWAVATPET